METSLFEQVFHEFYHQLIGTAYGFTKNIESSKDIVNDAFVEFYKAEFLDMLKAKAYLMIYVVSRCKNYIQHEKVKEKTNKEIRYIKMGDQENQQDTLSILIKNEFINLAYKEIEKLPNRCKEIVKLHIQGYNNYEIAEILHIAYQSVKNTKHDAYKLLRLKMQL